MRNYTNQCNLTKLYKLIMICLHCFANAVGFTLSTVLYGLIKTVFQQYHTSTEWLQRFRVWYLLYIADQFFVFFVCNNR